jgi:hypothetical protein
MKTLGLNVVAGRVTRAFALALAGRVAAADGLAVETVRSPTPIEIDMKSVKIDVAAHLRAIDASLRQAVIVGGGEAAEEPVTVAVADKRARLTRGRAPRGAPI